MDSSMSILSVDHLYKTYGEKVLFDYISFSISERQRIGLIGVNGTGKSTLLKVIAGLESPEKGEVTHAHSFRIEYLPQEPAFDEELTVLDQIYYGDSEIMKVLREYEVTLSALEMDPRNTSKQNRLTAMQQKMDENNAWDAITSAKTILTRLGITNFSQTVKDLSGGQKKRVAIAKALIQPADLLILDEPTNHLDHDIIEWLEGYLPQHPRALLVVTHDRYFLNRVANRIIELDQGKLYSYEGNYEVFLEKKAEREEQSMAEESKRQNLLRRELAWLRRGAKARTTKQKARIGRVEDLRDQKGHSSDEKLDIALGSNRLGKKVIELKEVTKDYGDERLIRGMDYLVLPHERLGIIGPNGSGKTTLLNLLAGRIEPDAGVVEVGSTVKIGYYTQDHADMNVNLRVIEYIKEVAEIVRTAEGQVITAEQMLERFLFSRSMQWNYVRSLSGGERRRLYLLRTLMGEPNVLFLDEPTNDLDTQTLAILEDYLDHFPGVVITVSHDRFFLDRVVDHLIAFEGKGVIRRFEGNYTEYLELRKDEKQAATESKKEKIHSDQTPQKKERPRKLTHKEQREWAEIEERIAALEERNTKLEQEIAQAGSDVGHVQSLYQEQQQVEKDIEQAIERWSELSLIVEQMDGSSR
jgi:ATP-binding cassette subfamily F protein uup